MRKFIYLFICLFISVNAFSQNINADSLFKIATNYAAVKNYDTAIKMAQALIKEFPQNNDYKIFLGIVYSWQGNYNLSIEILTPLVETDKINSEALEAIVNTHLWAENYSQVINYCDIGLTKVDNQSLFFRLKKAVALSKVQQYKGALDLTDTILIKYPDNKEAQALRTAIYQNKKNAISFSYQNTSFSNPSFEPWQLAYIEYNRKTNKLPFAVRMNYGNMFSKSATQYEIDLYPKLSATSYLYLNGGIAQGDYVFPQFRGGIEYYKSFKKISTSIGGRYLHFKSNQVILATGHIAYTINNFEIAYRSVVSLIDQKWYPSHVGSIKKSNDAKETFLQLDFQYGIIPFNFFVINEFDRVNSTRVVIQYQFRIKGTVFLRPIFMYEYEEYYPALFRNRYNAQIILTKRF